MMEYLEPDNQRFTPSLYSLNPDLFAEADRQYQEWEERETGIRPRCPQIVSSKIQEEDSDQESTGS